MANPFDSPDITIQTDDHDLAMEIWGIANAAKDQGNNGLFLSEKMEKSFTPERVHELWLVVNDALTSVGTLAAIWAAMKVSKGKKSIRIAARLKLSNGDQDNLKTLGCVVEFEKSEEDQGKA